MRYVHHQHHLHEQHHKNKFLNLCIEKCMWVAAVVAPLSTIPQILEIFKTHSVAGISIFTWTMFALLPVFWLAYGVTHKDKFIILNNALWIVVSTIVVLQVIAFR